MYCKQKLFPFENLASLSGTEPPTSQRVFHLKRRVLHLMRCFENESSTSAENTKCPCDKIKAM